MTILPILMLAAAACADALSPAAGAGAPDDERAPLYDEEASAWDDITEALTRAWRKNKRVLITWGNGH